RTTSPSKTTQPAPTNTPSEASPSACTATTSTPTPSSSRRISWPPINAGGRTKPMKILFSNPPWWENSEHSLRYGIRAGSRWPFTAPAHCAPDNFTFGGYLPYPFFMGYAASYVQRAFPGAKVTLRDSIALRESYAGWLLFLKHTRPDWIIIESATPSWAHDQ